MPENSPAPHDEIEGSLQSGSMKLARAEQVAERARLQVLRADALLRRIGVQLERVDQLIERRHRS